MLISNLYSDIPAALPEELVQTLLKTLHVRIERIVSSGHSTPNGVWHDQEQDEWVLLVKGSARLTLEDESIEMKPGDFLNIAAHCKHRVECTSPDEATIWLAVFYGPAVRA